MGTIELCHGKNSIITPEEKLCKRAKEVTWNTAREDVRAEGAKGIGGSRMRLRCPECGRSMIASVSVCFDGCCFHQYLPPHKPKGWWKKGVKKSSKGRPKKV